MVAGLVAEAAVGIAGIAAGAAVDTAEVLLCIAAVGAVGGHTVVAHHADLDTAVGGLRSLLVAHDQKVAGGPEE